MSKVHALHEFFQRAKGVESFYTSFDTKLVSVTGDAIPHTQSSCDQLLSELTDVAQSVFAESLPEPRLASLNELGQRLLGDSGQLRQGVASAHEREKVDAKMQQLWNKYSIVNNALELIVNY